MCAIRHALPGNSLVTKDPIKPITLKELAGLLELSQSTVSRVPNGAGNAHCLARETQERVVNAAALNGYSANTVARSLRQKWTYTIGVIISEISDQNRKVGCVMRTLPVSNSVS